MTNQEIKQLIEVVQKTVSEAIDKKLDPIYKRFDRLDESFLLINSRLLKM